MDWAPTLADKEGPVYRHIVDALAADINNGRLRRGQQLPTHRALAKALGIDLTTVTRAYTEARRRGLTEARVGLGTFVCETLSHVRHAAPPQPAFDLSMNSSSAADGSRSGRAVHAGHCCDPARGRFFCPSQLP